MIKTEKNWRASYSQSVPKLYLIYGTKTEVIRISQMDYLFQGSKTNLAEKVLVILSFFTILQFILIIEKVRI